MKRGASSQSIRFLVDRPYDDETISSALGRAMAVYGLRREGLLQLMTRDLGVEMTEHEFHLDGPSEALLLGLAGAFQMDINELKSHAVPDGPSWVPPKSRNAVCIRCLQIDLSKGLVPYFRRQWANIYTTFCYVHEAPLVTLKTGRKHISEIAVAQLETFQEQLATRHGIQFDSSDLILWSGKKTADALMAWERGMQKRPLSEEDPATSLSKAVRDRAELITLVGTVRSAERGYTAAGALHLGSHEHSEEEGWYLAPGPAYAPSARSSTWEDFRFCSDVESRRAAYFWAAGSFETNWPMDFVNTFTWLKGVRSRSTDWWLSVIRTRFVGHPEDQAKIDDLARRAFVSGYPDVSGHEAS